MVCSKFNFFSSLKYFGIMVHFCAETATCKMVTLFMYLSIAQVWRTKLSFLNCISCCSQHYSFMLVTVEILKIYYLGLMKERMNCHILWCTFLKYSKLVCGMFCEKRAPKIFSLSCSSWSSIPHAWFEINSSQCLLNWLSRFHCRFIQLCCYRKLFDCLNRYGSVVLSYTCNCSHLF
jgi:hypothetical protein